MFIFHRPVRFQDVDVARIVFFARYAEYCHDAVEALFASLPGGYPALTQDRDVGVPTVNLEVKYSSPLRYGDTAVIHLEATHVGRRSFTLGYTFFRNDSGVVCATVQHTMVTAKLSEIASVDLPEDVRSVLEAHHSPIDRAR